MTPEAIVLQVPSPEQFEHENVLESHDSNHLGEAPDVTSTGILKLTYSAIAKFPELAHKYRVFSAGKYVVSAALVGMVSFAVYKELTAGKHPDKILEDITADHIENAGKKFDPSGIKKKLSKIGRGH